MPRIFRILGIKELTENFVNQVEVYRLQGVIINDKHIETILRQMLKKVEVKLSVIHISQEKLLMN